MNSSETLQNGLFYLICAVLAYYELAMAKDKISDVDRLLRGISTGDAETIRDAWRSLLTTGEPAVLAVLDKLSTPAWSEYRKGPFAQYLGTLLAILDEMDPTVERQPLCPVATTMLAGFESL